MRSRAAVRALVLPRAALHRAATLGRRTPAKQPRRVLICHHLLLGDTLMLTPLVAKLRHQFPAAEIVMTMAKAYTPLYAGKPYGLIAKPFDPKSRQSVAALAREGGFELAIIPGDNRFSWTAAAMQSRWIIALANDRPAYKSWPVDEFREWPATPTTLEDTFMSLVAGSDPPAFRRELWSAPHCEAFNMPTRPFALLHLGASSILKLWEPEKWRALADWLEDQQGLQVVWSAGPGEQALVAAVDPKGTRTAFAGKPNLTQVWHLLANAKLLICPDTGIAHLAKVTATPTLVLFGQGARNLFSPSRFWGNIPWKGVSVDPFACRDQHTLFKRHIPWVVRCQRSPRECPAPRCMRAISGDSVQQAAEELLSEPFGSDIRTMSTA